jgi:hypothetical protein
MSETVVTTIISVVVTIAVGCVAFYLAGRQLRDEAAKLRQLNKLILHAVEHAGFAEVKRDPNGEPTGIVLSAVGNFKATPATTDIRGTVNPGRGLDSSS